MSGIVGSLEGGSGSGNWRGSECSLRQGKGRVGQGEGRETCRAVQIKAGNDCHQT